MKKGIRGHSSHFEKKCARIKALALFHRYGWPFLILILLAASSKGNPTSGVLAVSGILIIVYAAYTYFGYRLHWTHIFCSFQSVMHRPMTPYNVKWNEVRKCDVYIVSTILFVIGLLLISCLFFGDVIL